MLGLEINSALLSQYQTREYQHCQQKSQHYYFSNELGSSSATLGTFSNEDGYEDDDGSEKLHSGLLFPSLCGS